MVLEHRRDNIIDNCLISIIGGVVSAGFFWSVDNATRISPDLKNAPVLEARFDESDYSLGGSVFFYGYENETGGGVEASYNLFCYYSYVLKQYNKFDEVGMPVDANGNRLNRIIGPDLNWDGMVFGRTGRKVN